MEIMLTLTGAIPSIQSISTPTPSESASRRAKLRRKQQDELDDDAEDDEVSDIDIEAHDEY